MRVSAFLSFQEGGEIYKLGLAKKYEAILYKEFKNEQPAFIEIQYSDTPLELAEVDEAEESEAEAVEKREQI